MKTTKTLPAIGIIIFFIILFLSLYYFIKPETPTMEDNSAPIQIPTNTNNSTTTPVVNVVDKTKTVIGKSVDKNEIVAYHYGSGEKEILLVGGIHGGYSWNTVSLAYELMDYLAANPNSIPASIKVTVIPVLNPDGLKKVTGTSGRFTNKDVSTSQTILTTGRFNANNVDLSRNFDCNWKPTGVWQTKPVSGGANVFSEPESIALKNYVDTNTPVASVVWYSAAGGVYSSSCNEGVLPETMKIADAYAKGSTYPAFKSFDFYETTGDVVNWFASKNIPAISVLLTTHQDTEWTKNLAGVKSLISHYTK